MATRGIQPYIQERFSDLMANESLQTLHELPIARVVDIGTSPPHPKPGSLTIGRNAGFYEGGGVLKMTCLCSVKDIEQKGVGFRGLVRNMFRTFNSASYIDGLIPPQIPA